MSESVHNFRQRVQAKGNTPHAKPYQYPEESGRELSDRFDRLTDEEKEIVGRDNEAWVRYNCPSKDTPLWAAFVGELDTRAESDQQRVESKPTDPPAE
jgi:hypothetical protein